MGLFSKKKRTVIVEESPTEQTESAVCKDNALGDVAPKNVGKLDMVIAFVAIWSFNARLFTKRHV